MAIVVLGDRVDKRSLEAWAPAAGPIIASPAALRTARSRRGRPGRVTNGRAMGETFGQRLRRLREAAGLSVPELAGAVGSSEGTIRQLENGGVKSPAFVLGLRLAEELGVDPYYLARGEGHSVTERFASIERRVFILENAAKPKGRRP